jgi:hypothetical protein
MNTLQSVWQTFEAQVIPRNAHQTQRQEMRRAFYAGSSAVLSIMLGVSGDDVSEEAGAMILDGLHKEARQFVADVSNGAA